MKYWNEMENNVLFNKIFSTQVAIGSVSLYSITIDNDRPTITIEFDIPELPDKAPEKWKKSGFNTCRIGIRCGDICSLTIKNIPTKKNLKVTILETEDGFTVTLLNKDSLITFSTELISLCGPSVYMNSLDEWQQSS